MRTRMKPEQRREQLLKAAVELSKKHGYDRITHQDIAEHCGVTKGLVVNYWTMTQLRRQIIRKAIQDEVLEVIAQGLIKGDRHAQKASTDLKTKALQRFAG